MMKPSTCKKPIHLPIIGGHQLIRILRSLLETKILMPKKEQKSERINDCRMLTGDQTRTPQGK